jgi:ribokinase
MLWIIGSCNIDLTVKVERFPNEGETVLALESHISVGGKGANQAVGAAVWKINPKLIASVGSDTFGKQAFQTLQQYGVDTSSIVASDKHPTGMAWIEIDKRGNNRITVVPGANVDLLAGQILPNLVSLKETDYVLAQLEIPVKSVESAFAYAKRKGATTILNLSPSFEGVEVLLSLTDLLVLNEKEYCQLTKISSFLEAMEEAKAHFFRYGITALVVTAGELGAFLSMKNSSFVHFPSPKVQVVDSSGAGDAFLGTFSAWMVMGKSIEEALKAAVISGSLACCRLGTMSAIPDPMQVLQHLKNAI